MNLWPIIGIFALLFLSAFFSASEISFTSVNKLRLKIEAENGSKGAKLAAKILDKYNAFLYTVLIANNAVNILASSLATYIFINLLGDLGVGVATLVMTVLIMFFGEIIPKTIGKQRAEGTVKSFAYPIQLFMTILKPVVVSVEWLIDKAAKVFHLAGGDALPTVTEEEFAAILETVEDEGVIDEERTELLHSALEFDDITAQEVLTPRMDVYAIDLEDDPLEIRDIVMKSRYSRIPVYKSSIDNIVGILYVNTYLRAYALEHTVELEKHIQPPLFIHKTMKLDDALNLLRHNRVHVAVVLDEFGGTLGIISMEDILEELVGEIWDENDDVVDDWVKIDDYTFECEGSMALHDFFDQLETDTDDLESDYTTVGGWAIEMMDAMPKVGDSFSYENHNITVLKLEGMRVERLRVETASAKEVEK